MKKTRITDKITYVEPDSMTNFTSCAGIIVNSVKKVMVDTNMGPGHTSSLLELEQPDAAIITHYHLDHSIWTRQVAAHTNARIFIPEPEENYLTSLDFVIEQTAQPFGMAEEWKNFVKNNLGYKALGNHECYSNATSFKDLAPEMVIVETPGHSPSHTSFYFPDEKILFSGDMGLDRFGPWYGWKDCSIKKIVDSILRLDGMDIGLILTSHGGIVKKNFNHAWAKAISMILDRENKIRKKLDSGISPDEIIRQGVFYVNRSKVNEPMKSFLNMWDTAMYEHHETLLKQGGLEYFFPHIVSYCSDQVSDSGLA